MKENKELERDDIAIDCDMDVTSEKQKEIISAFGDNCNYDVVPITVIETEQESEAECYEDDEVFTLGEMT